MTNRKLFLRSCLLSLPLVVFLLHHYLYHSPDLIPTGFTQSDNVVYIANTRQYLESSKPTLTYSNPFDDSPVSPSIYSQPYNFILYCFLVLSIDPGLSLSIFGILSAVFCIFFLLKLVDHLYPSFKRKSILHLLVVWGGGLTAIAGLFLTQLFFQDKYEGFWGGMLLIDPGNGWWGMNFGRTLVIPVEGFYHLLFIAGVFLMIRHKWIAALIISFLLSWSHPFTGIEYLCIVSGWLFVERILVRNQLIPWSFCIATVGLLALHLFYYLFFLNSFPEHKKLFETFSVDWGYSYRVFIPAYFLVGVLAFLTIFKKTLKNAFQFEHQRLFFSWAVIAFLLSNHEWFMKPIQPIHFTRGYIWLGLFLFGIPGLEYLFHSLKNRIVLVFLILLFLSDNILWYGSLLFFKAKTESVGHISRDSKEVLQWLKSNTTTSDLLVSNEYMISYMANAYGSSKSWTGHIYNTPDFSEKKKQAENFFKTGIPLSQWKNRRILILVNKREIKEAGPALKGKKLFENGTYVLYSD